MKIKKQTRHSTLRLILTANYISVFAYSLFAPLFALLVIDHGGTTATVGYIWGFYGVLTGVTSLIFGRIEDGSKYLFHHLHIIGSLLLAVASFAYVIADTLQGIVLGQLLFALGFGLLNPAFRKLYAALEDKGREATEWGWLEGGNMMLAGFAAAAGGVILQATSHPKLFVAMGCMQLFATVLLYRALQKQR